MIIEWKWQTDSGIRSDRQSAWKATSQSLQTHVVWISENRKLKQRQNLTKGKSK